MSKYLEDLRRGEPSHELRKRHLDPTGAAEELQDCLESWLISNGHDPEDYLFIDPFLRSTREEIIAKFESLQASMEWVETVALAEDKIIEVHNGDRVDNFAGLEKKRKGIEEVPVVSDAPVLCPIASSVLIEKRTKKMVDGSTLEEIKAMLPCSEELW